MKTTWIIVGVVAVALIGWFLLSNMNKGTAEPIAQACPADAMICPDGTSVGRVGPTCEFAACPQVLGETVATTTLAIGASDEVAGIQLKVVSLVEDSRCPSDVQCIQAGTVRVKVLVSGSEYTLTLNKPEVIGALSLTLVDATPAKKSGQTITPQDYRFTFTIAQLPKG